MPAHHVERVLPYSPDQLFTLVGDVRRYPEFVPWITSMRAGEPRLLDALLVANFDRAVNKLIACFEARAATLYAPVRTEA